MSAKRDGQGEKEGSKATEDISDEDEKEDNWDEDMEKVSENVGTSTACSPKYYYYSSFMKTAYEVCCFSSSHLKNKLCSCDVYNE
jgi:hypothetical protein